MRPESAQGFERIEAPNGDDVPAGVASVTLVGRCQQPSVVGASQCTGLGPFEQQPLAQLPRKLAALYGLQSFCLCGDNRRGFVVRSLEALAMWERWRQFRRSRATLIRRSDRDDGRPAVACDPFSWSADQCVHLDDASGRYGL